MGRQLLARGDAKLQLNQIEAGDHLGDGVFDLQARVHFHEPEAVGTQRARAVDDEFDRAGIAIADCARGHHGGVRHRLADFGGHAGGGGFLDHFLAAALQRAIAFEQVDIVAVIVAEHLHFDVARVLDELLDQHAIVAKTALGFALGAGELRLEILVGVDLPHAATAATGDGLDEHGIAHLLGGGFQRFDCLVFAMVAGRHGHAVLFHQRLGGVLQAHGADRLRRRADPCQASLDDRFGESRVLRQEAIAGMDRFGAGLERGLDDAVALEIALGGRRRANVHGVIRLANEGGVCVDVRIHRDRSYPEPTGSAHDPTGDFATVGDEER